MKISILAVALLTIFSFSANAGNLLNNVSYTYDKSCTSSAKSSCNNSQASPNSKHIKVATMCFKTGEEISGMNKICYYDCLGSAAAITISSVSLCPLTINR
jgi:hypothetical protein